jgi:hypothetical protein
VTRYQFTVLLEPDREEPHRYNVRVPALPGCLTYGESVDDALAGCTAIALRRASLYGRAPVMPDLRLALTIWGFFDASPPDELVNVRRPAFENVADSLHHYEERRTLVDSVPEATLRQTLEQVRAAYPASWRTLLGR